MKASGNSKKKFIFLGLGLGVLTLGGLGWWYFGKKKDSSNDSDLMEEIDNAKSGNSKAASKKGLVSTNTANKAPTKPSAPKPQSPTPKPGGTLFPLKAGSKGDYVKNVQQALITKYGNVLPKSGADGKFGAELTNALKAKGFPTVVDQATYNKIIALNNPKPLIKQEDKDNILIAKNIWLYSTTKKISPLVDTLKKITSVAHYIKVNNLFKTVKLNGKRQTIVNGTLSSFSDSTAKQFLKNEFLRIGLKYNDGTWSLAGIEEKQVYTTRATTICCPDGKSQSIPANTLLGMLISRDRHKTRFRSFDNRVLNVSSNHTNYV